MNSSLKRVSVERYEATALGPQTPLLTDAMTVRRMSWLQKAVMECVTRWQHDDGARLDTILALGAPVYFSTIYGEMDATLSVAGSLLNRQLPVSPTAFQHSVHNAAAGYATIAMKTRNASATMSAGFLSFDKTLLWAFEELRHGKQPAAIILTAAEHVEQGAEFATAEMLVLTASNDAPKPGQWELIGAICENLAEGGVEPKAEGSGNQLFQETKSHASSAPLRLDRMTASFHRIVTSSTFSERIASQWRL